LAHVCREEGIEFEEEALPLLAEAAECHIRDALKAIEGISMLGPVNRANMEEYLQLDVNNTLLEILENLGAELPAVFQKMSEVLARTSPASTYAKLASLSMLAYQHHIGAVVPPVFWDRDRLAALGERHGAALLGFASRFSSRPSRPTTAMLSCDLAHLHHGGPVVEGASPIVVAALPPPSPNPTSSNPAPSGAPGNSGTKTLGGEVSSEAGKVAAKLPSLGAEGVCANERAVGKPEQGSSEETPSGTTSSFSGPLTPSEFCRLLALQVRELSESACGPQGRADMGCH